jgi:hypothetical protein
MPSIEIPGVTVKIVGGLGNQLFGYAAGLALATKLECPLYLDISWFNKYKSSTYALDQFNLRAELKNNSYDSFTKKWFSIEYLSNKAGKFFPQLNSNIFKEKSFSFDKSLLEQKKGVTLEGYFQSWKYFESINLEISALLSSPKSTSYWYKSTVVNHKLLDSVIGVHVRLGDYSSPKVSKVIGNLSHEYYFRAVRSLSSQSKLTKLLLISNEPHKIDIPFSEWGYETYTLKPPLGVSDFESLLVLSKCSAIVLANSSFSWWAGWLSKIGTPVTVPDPWFKKIKYNKDDLHLSNWQQISWTIT